MPAFRRLRSLTPRGIDGRPVTAPIEEVWHAWTTPDDIRKWNAASDHWHTTAASVSPNPEASKRLAREIRAGYDCLPYVWAACWLAEASFPPAAAVGRLPRPV